MRTTREAWGALARWRARAPLAWRVTLYLALFVALLVADAICTSAALPVVVRRDANGVTIQAGSVTRHIATRAELVAITLPPRDPVVHEYQLDGADSANNFTLDPAYVHSIINTTYYRFTAWMRGLDNLSRWRNLCASVGGDAPRCLAAPPIASGAALSVPSGFSQRVTVNLQQPETAATLDLALSDSTAIALTIDPNGHAITITPLNSLQANLAPITTYYPNDPGDLWPQAAQVMDLLIRVLLWSLGILGGVWVIEVAVGWVIGRLAPGARANSFAPRSYATNSSFVDSQIPEPSPRRRTLWPTALRREFIRPPSAWWSRLVAAIHPVGLALIAVAFGFTCWIALAQYHAQPHIYDASAYLFGAKIFASGRLFAPAPSLPAQFPGPFMVDVSGKWFPQYEPGTSAALAVGVLLGVPWLIEPLMGALALLGIGLTLRRLYDRRVATVAVALGACSPFFLWLTASYLSHAVALCFLSWMLWALTRFAQGGRGWNLPLAAALWGAALLTRDTATPFVAVAVVGLGWVAWRERWAILQRRNWAKPLIATTLVVAVALATYFDYNALLTGSPFVAPRALFFPGDHWGFGPGIGFYGQHTLAAGFITVNALLTELAITLYGWPFYLTLAFIPLPFLAWRARSADWFLLAGALVMVFIWLGYFYHGIYLGPRYLFEALPFLLGLTARGIVTLYEVGRAGREQRFASQPAKAGFVADRPLDATSVARSRGFALPSVAAPALLLALLAWAALYYFPRQMTLYSNFTGMAAGTTIQTATLAHPPIHHAIIITDNGQLYGYTLFALNDPTLSGDDLYAYATNSSDYAALQRAYPTRTLYLLNFDKQGRPEYTLVVA